MKYLSLYNEHQARRHEVRPGFTGLAQVSGRNTISWKAKFDLDVEYVDHITFLGDWKIIFKTVWTVLNEKESALKHPQPWRNSWEQNLLKQKTMRRYSKEEIGNYR